MEEAELLKKMVLELENQRDSSRQRSSERKNRSAEGVIEGIHETRTISLKEAIIQIQEQISLREELHKQMIENIENLKSSISNMMPHMPTPTIEFQKAMIELKKKLIEAEEMKVREKLDCFRDIALLKKELRETVREFTEKEKRASFLGELLSE